MHHVFDQELLELPEFTGEEEECPLTEEDQCEDGTTAVTKDELGLEDPPSPKTKPKVTPKIEANRAIYTYAPGISGHSLR